VKGWKKQLRVNGARPCEMVFCLLTLSRLGSHDSSLIIGRIWLHVSGQQPCWHVENTSSGVHIDLLYKP
jgi:hypothetical protein